MQRYTYSRVSSVSGSMNNTEWLSESTEWLDVATYSGVLEWLNIAPYMLLDGTMACQNGSMYSSMPELAT